MVQAHTPDAHGLPTRSELDDAELVRGVLAGQRDLFAVLMRRHNPRMFRIARGITRTDADAQDAVQAAFLSAFRALSEFRGDARLSSWLSRIVVREALSRAAQQRRALERTREVESESLRSLAPSPETRVHWGRLRGVLEDLVDGLPDPQRVVFVMRDVQELSTQETAEALQITEEAVRVRLFRARQQLRREIEATLELPVTELFRFDGARCDRIVARVWAALEAERTSPQKAERPS